LFFKIPAPIGFFINKPGYITTEAPNSTAFVCIVNLTAGKIKKRANNFPVLLVF